MEAFELSWVKLYAERLNHTEGDLSELTKDERKHLALLLRKYELEQQSAEIDSDLSQAKLL